MDLFWRGLVKSKRGRKCTLKSKQLKGCWTKDAEFKIYPNLNHHSTQMCDYNPSILVGKFIFRWSYKLANLRARKILGRNPQFGKVAIIKISLCRRGNDHIHDLRWMFKLFHVKHCRCFAILSVSELNWHTKEFQIKRVLWHFKVLACSWKGIFHFMKVKALVGQKKLHKKFTCGWQNEDRSFSLRRMRSLTMTWSAHIILLSLPEKE